MDKYIVVSTYCDKEEIADQIVSTLLSKRLVTGCQITKIKSKYWWAGEIELSDEFAINMRSKESLFPIIEQEIKKIHDYEVAEISYREIMGASTEFFEWIDENLIKKDEI